MWLLYSVISAFTAALVALFAKIGLKTLDPTLATTIRTMLMAVLLVLLSGVTGKFRDFSFAALTSRDWILIGLSGVAGAASLLFYFFALKIGSATHVVVIDRLGFIFVFVFAALFLGEVLTWRSVAGIAFMVAGALLIITK